MNLRELMVEEIKRYGWFDYVYTRSLESSKPNDENAYVKWLSALSDVDFLATYNLVRDAENDLD